MAHTGFFTATPVSEDTFISVGGEVFHALAIALLDHLKSHHRDNDFLQKEILGSMFRYYPQFEPKKACFTPTEQFNLFLRQAGRSKAVECMAFVLRQLAVNEFFAAPLSYREVFDGLSAITPKNFLRQPTTVLPASVFSALAKALHLEIAVSYTEQGKELRMLKRYTHDTNNTMHPIKLVIQVQKDQYFPKVKHPADYTYVGHLALTPLAPVLQEHDVHETVAAMVDLIAEDNKRLLQTYLTWHANLLTMLDGEEISLKELTNLYIDYLSSPNGILMDTNAFFAELSQANKNPITDGCLKELNKQFKELLVHALAGWISVGKVDADQLMERKEGLSL